jgi:ABC-type Fe3+-hydroxamate transport system substrate-binding protein
MPPDDPRRHPARTAVLAGLVGDGVGRRVFIDATGTGVALPPVVRRLVGADPLVVELLRAPGAPVVSPVGEPGHPDPAAVAAQRPDVIVVGAVDRVVRLDPHVVAALRAVAPVVAVDVGRPAEAAADLRALLGSADYPPPERPPGPPRVVPPRLG